MVIVTRSWKTKDEMLRETKPVVTANTRRYNTKRYLNISIFITRVHLRVHIYIYILTLKYKHSYKPIVTWIIPVLLKIEKTVKSRYFYAAE